MQLHEEILHWNDDEKDDVSGDDAEAKSDNLMCKRVDDDTKLIFRFRAAAFEQNNMKNYQQLQMTVINGKKVLMNRNGQR